MIISPLYSFLYIFVSLHNKSQHFPLKKKFLSFMLSPVDITLFFKIFLFKEHCDVVYNVLKHFYVFCFIVVLHITRNSQLYTSLASHPPIYFVIDYPYLIFILYYVDASFLILNLFKLKLDFMKVLQKVIIHRLFPSLPTRRAQLLLLPFGIM